MVIYAGLFSSDAYETKIKMFFSQFLCLQAIHKIFRKIALQLIKMMLECASKYNIPLV